MALPAVPEHTVIAPRPARTVKLEPFCLGQTEVTRGAWEKARAGGCTACATSMAEAEWAAESERLEQGAKGRYKGFDVKLVPVNVEIAEAEAYCRHVGGRLPTMIEWQHAALGKTRTAYPWGPSYRGEEEIRSARGWSAYPKLLCVQTEAVEPACNAGKSPRDRNSLGLYDMFASEGEVTSDHVCRCTMQCKVERIVGGSKTGSTSSPFDAAPFSSIAEGGQPIGVRCVVPPRLR